MKTNTILAVALSACIIFSSCSKEKTGEVPTNEPARLTITVADSKAAGSIDADNAINSFVAYVFTSSGALQDAIESTNGQQASSASVTTNATDLYIVANVTKATMGTIANKSELLQKTFDLANGNNPTQVGTGGGSLLASGYESLSGKFALDNNNKYAYNATVQLTFVPARVNFNLKNQIADGVIKKFVMQGVTVINASTKSLLFGTNLYTSPIAFYSGIDVSAFPEAVAGTLTKTFLTDAVTSTDQSFHYYLFENSEANPTILAAYGELSYQPGKYPGQGPQTYTRYFPLHFASYENITNVEPVRRGQSYNVVMTTTGNADNDPGLPNPFVPSIDADLKVEVTVKPWVAKPISKDF